MVRVISHRLAGPLAGVLLAATGCSAAQPTPRPTPQSAAAETAGPGMLSPAAEPPAAPGQRPPAAPPPLTPKEPVAANTRPGLARQILFAESAIRTLTLPEADLAAAGHLQQVAYRELAARPRWDAAVLRRIPKPARPIVRANVAAHRELSSLSGAPPRTLPEWRIVAPAPRKRLLGYYGKAQRRYGVPWQYLAAIHLVETRMGRISGTSTAGAQGPMQFIPSTWRMYGRGDIRDNHDAIMAAARYLRARGAPQNMERALFSYNNDVRYVRAVAAYARVMLADPRAYRGYYHWQVYYRQPGGPVWLPVGYDGTS